MSTQDAVPADAARATELAAAFQSHSVSPPDAATAVTDTSAISANSAGPSKRDKYKKAAGAGPAAPAAPKAVAAAAPAEVDDEEMDPEKKAKKVRELLSGVDLALLASLQRPASFIVMMSRALIVAPPIVDPSVALRIVPGRYACQLPLRFVNVSHAVATCVQSL